ncbi:MAG: helix-turn-helix domain-containing protein [Lachnospiraceae bacterium]|jgi:DNA-binding XRE family transcriptional regulator|nr:helix-turn-helix domain-containing protein [Lachnospiraceae bacterium]
MNEKLSNNIEQARLARGYTQKQVADAIGVSRPTYASIESGEKELTICQAKTLSSMLRITIDDILGAVDGLSVFTDVLKSTEKYKQIILNAIRYGADEDGKITKTKLAKLVYLADFIWYYLNLTPMSGMTYRKLPRGPVADVYFRALDEMEDDGTIIREPKGKAVLFFLVEKNAPTSRLSHEELDLIIKIGKAWQGKPTDDVVNFTHEQLPWQICRHGEIIPYGLITQEEPERVYGDIQL